MNFRLKIGRFAGIDVFLHWTFLFSPFYVAFDGWRNGFSLYQICILLLLLIAVFICIVFHEFGHALAAKVFSIKTRDIMITPIGGLARLEKMPRKALQELVVTLAGPLVNLLIAMLLSLLIWAGGSSFRPDSGFPGLADFPKLLVWINLFLFAFNLVPAFPMDGGRVLRSSIALILGFERATLIAGLLGQILALSFLVFGMTVLLFQQSFSAEFLSWANPLSVPLAIIGVFVYFAAGAEISYSRFLVKTRSENSLH